MLSKRQIWSKNWRQSISGRKCIRIKNWKKRGVIHTDFDSLYELYLKTDKCDKCNCIFGKKGDGSGTFKCMDHCHKTGEFRNILCNSCNINTDRVDNTSGFPNIYNDKRGNNWRYQKTINGVVHLKCFKTKKEAVAYKKEYESNL